MSLNRVTVTDAYSVKDEGPMSSVTVLVYNQPVVAQLGQGNPPDYDSSDPHELPNGASVKFDIPCDGIRFKNARPGQAAAVTTIPTYRS